MDFRNWRSLCTRKFEQRYSSLLSMLLTTLCGTETASWECLLTAILGVRAVADG